MHHVVLVSFNPDANPADVEDFLSSVPGIVRRFPWISLSEGVGLKVVPNSADWGFIAEVADRSDIDKWVDSEAHGELVSKLRPVRGSAMNYQVGV